MDTNGVDNVNERIKEAFGTTSSGSFEPVQLFNGGSVIDPEDLLKSLVEKVDQFKLDSLTIEMNGFKITATKSKHILEIPKAGAKDAPLNSDDLLYYSSQGIGI